MANEEHLAILKQGVEVWNKWREENVDICPDLSWQDLRGLSLSNANFAGAYLHMTNLNYADLTNSEFNSGDLSNAVLISAKLNYAEFIDANLSNVDLFGAKLNFADFSGANLSGANLALAELTSANLSKANLLEAHLEGTNLSQTLLYWANLSNVKLDETNFDGSLVGWTNFADVDFRQAKGIGTVRHSGPSYLDIHSFYRSHGEIPHAFLRSAGIDDAFISYVPSHFGGKPIRVYSCFISHSSADKSFVERLHADLRANGVQCWYAPSDMKGGRKTLEQIEDAIIHHDKLLLVLSENSMGSGWVETEIRRTRKEEIDKKRQKLFPIRLSGFDAIQNWRCFDSDTGRDMATEVREYHIPDFSNWKDHDSYKLAFEHLLKDLRAEDQARADKEKEGSTGLKGEQKEV